MNVAYTLFATHSRRLQVDIQWLPSALCSLQSRVVSHDPRGCFVLNHDTVDSTSRRTINSTEDLVAYLPLVPQFQDASRQTFLSLCFKGCGGLLCPCGGSSLTNRFSDNIWLSLVDDFLDNLNSTIAKHALNVRIVLDGTANPAATHSPCLAERWRPLPSLFTAGDGKRLAALQICVSCVALTVPDASLWNDTSTLGWDRLVFLNNPVDQWSAAAAEKWGKFDSRPGPLICWEPSDQTEVQNVYKTFSSSGSDHSDGVLIASNTDPAMFQVCCAHLACPLPRVTTAQVYAAGQSSAALNSPLPLLGNSTSSGHVRIATAVPVSSSVNSSPQHPAANLLDTASQFSVVCTVSESSGSSVINYVSRELQRQAHLA